ncbi:hypothetical protein [Hydrogenophaga sp.]|uniref:hypothetical protein n=1 Tax=Hydrogenophaga sp. TaxID=1904254 RepID=UPI0025BA03C3|nr:hypothetical protein [Hydrogenophaga sp.]
MTLKPQDPQPEHWRHDAGTGTVAVMTIPGLLSRARVFDVDATLVVDVPVQPAADAAWLELTVEFDGKRQWSRRIPAHNPGQTDGLEYHQRVRLEAEQALRVRAVVKVSGASVRQLQVEAREAL